MAEVYASTPDRSDLDVQSSGFVLDHAGEFFTATGVEAGPGFLLEENTIVDAAGTVDDEIPRANGRDRAGSRRTR